MSTRSTVSLSTIEGIKTMASVGGTSSYDGRQLGGLFVRNSKRADYKWGGAVVGGFVVPDKSFSPLGRNIGWAIWPKEPNPLFPWRMSGRVAPMTSGEGTKGMGARYLGALAGVGCWGGGVTGWPSPAHSRRLSLLNPRRPA